MFVWTARQRAVYMLTVTHFVFIVANPQSAVTWLDFTWDSERIITASKDGSIRIWNINGNLELTLSIISCSSLNVCVDSLNYILYLVVP